MKSIKMFGKSVPLVAIVLACLLTIGASAVLVNYLSNTVGGDFTVVSPMRVGVSLGKDSWATTQCYRPAGPPNPADWEGSGDFPGGLVDSFPEGIDSGGNPIKDWAWTDWTTTGTLVLPDVFGGGTMTIYLMSTNLANAEVKGFEEVIITNDDEVTHEDFVSVLVRVDSIFGDLGYGEEHDLIALNGYVEIDGDNIAFGSPALSTWGEGETDVTKIVVTFEEAASGTYTLSYRITPEVPP